MVITSYFLSLNVVVEYCYKSPSGDADNHNNEHKKNNLI